MRSLSLLVFALWLAVPASADVRTYCEAYARDVANGRVSGGEILNGKIAGTMPETSPRWTEVNGKAMAGCMAQYGESADNSATAEVASVEATPPPPPPKKQKTAANAVTLVPGSKAWNDYCDKKYSSFDRKTGMYRSLKGLARPCKVAKR